MKVYSKKWLSCLSALFVLGLAISVSAQQLHPVRVSASEEFGGTNVPHMIGGVKRPIDLLPLGMQLQRVKARRIDTNGPKPRYSGMLYDNTANTSGTVYYTDNSGVPYNVIFYDDFTLPYGMTKDGPAAATTIVFPVYNDTTNDQNELDVLIAIYPAVDVRTATDNVIKGDPIMVLGVSSGDISANPIAAGSAATFAVDLSSMPIMLDRDGASSFTGPDPYGPLPFGFVIGYTTDNTFTAFNSIDTPLFNPDGVTTGYSQDRFGIDLNGDGKFVRPGEEFHFVDANLNANFLMSLGGTAVDDVTYSFRGTVEFEGLVNTAAPQNIELNLVSLTGAPLIKISSTVSIIDDPANPGHAIGNYAAYGIPPDMYNLVVKSDHFLAGNTYDTPTDPTSTLSVLDLTTGNLVVNATVAPVTTYLPYGGDADNNNVIDGLDFGALVNVYGDTYTPGDPMASPADVAADFNGDGTIDIADFGILAANYTNVGDPFVP